MWNAVVIGILAAALVNAKGPAGDRPVLRFAIGEEGGGLGIETHNFTTFSAIGRGARARWIVERSTEESNWCGSRSSGKCQSTTTKSHQYIDANDCPALHAEVARLTAVRLKERNGAHPEVSDTPLTELITYRGMGLRTERLAEYVGPLADWWRQAQIRLTPCWTNIRPPDL